MSPRPRLIRTAVLLAALACLAVIPVKPKPVPTPGPAPAPTWGAVDLLVKDQKFEEAARQADVILRAARERKDGPEWTKALIREVQLREGLHGYETAVRFLKDEAWPADLISRTALELFYAQSLVTYAQRYSWEISQRERVESTGTVDLKAWTREQIFEEAGRAYQALWIERDALGREPIQRLSEFITVNAYPEGIRNTLRDAVAYFYAALFADSAGWSPAQSNAVFTLDLPGLLHADAAAAGAVKLDDASVHPVVKLVGVLADLEAWHNGRGEREAAFEARLERLRRLHVAFAANDAGSADSTAIERDLEERLPAMADLPWFSMGKAQLAEFFERPDRQGNLVRAHDVAEEGRRAYPESVGGRRCLAIVKQIEAPDYQLRTMRNDGPQRRSVLVTHRNVAKLVFRAFAVDLAARVASAKDIRAIVPSSLEVSQMIGGQTPAAEWTVSLPATPDYKTHSTFVVPPMKEKGFYVIAASGAPRFGGPGFPLVSAGVVISDLVLVLPQMAERGADGAGFVEIQALSGATGGALAGVAVTLLRGSWNPTRVDRIAEAATDATGRAKLQVREEKEWSQRFVFARKGQDLAIDGNFSSSMPPEPPGPTTGSIVFTDRTIYRPLQKVLWKALAYRGEAAGGRFVALPHTPVTVTLFDQNNQNVASQTVTTDDFGSVAGEFSIPEGRVLGSWRVGTSLDGYGAQIRVEEYKRPTFEVTLKDPVDPLRLNRPARLTGEARYYFGLPVATGSVRWRVTRTPQYPWWYWWRGWIGPVRTETVAAGVSALQADGSFTLAFTPAADERLSGDRKGVEYSYVVVADASDEGGETRSASRVFRLGFVSIEARIDMPHGFVREAAAERVKIVRASLDGVPRAGKGSWRIVRLEQPPTPALPADLPPDRPQIVGTEVRTPGDSLRPRWDVSYAPDRVMAGWEDGAEVSRGDVVHGDGGEGFVEIAGLAPGAYRLRYRTMDEFGAEFEMPKEFLVVGKRTPVALAAILVAESGSVPVGGTARLLAASGLAGQPLTLEIDRDGRAVERRILTAGQSPSLIEIPITEKDRGGFGVRLTMLRDHQFVTLSQPVFVPWDDKELKVSFATFRDRLRPGQRETWTVKVEGPKGSPLAPGAAQLLAYMYDRSLDAFTQHLPANVLSIYPTRTSIAYERANLGEEYFQHVANDFLGLPLYPNLAPDRLKFYVGNAIGGMGRNYGDIMVSAAAPALLEKSAAKDAAEPARTRDDKAAVAPASPPATADVPLRSQFAETAFWEPHLLTGADGSASIEFTVPDSVTSWNVWVHAVTRDLKAGFVKKETKSVKELMVRPYVPRFLREGDLAELQVVVNNATDRGMSGKVTLDILDTQTNASVLAQFGLTPERAVLAFSASSGGGADVTFRLAAPRRVGSYAFKATAVSGDFSDGELRPVPVLPGRMQLSQSRFVTMREGDRRTMTFADMARTDDPTRIDEQLVVTVDGQLFYSVLSALPYLVNYPYECTEQTLNRFVSTGIVSSVFRDYPAVAKMATELSKRDTRLEIWDAPDPNRKMILEETPWLETARGGRPSGQGLVRVLDPRIALADREAGLAKLRKAQTDSGGFPWWPGGPPDPYMTLYILRGFANALEFGVEVPKDMVTRAWAYAGADIRRDLEHCMHAPGFCQMATFLNYTLSSYPDESWYAPAFNATYRRYLLDYSFGHWKVHSPYLKAQLALTLKRMGRPQDAKRVWDSVMDSAKTDRDLGTYWAPEDRSWLWYNDTIETQAFALRTLTELEPADPRRHGLVQWLFLNKKLNQWKSTRATAEVIYAMVWYLKKEGALSVREAVTVEAANQKTTFTFEPDQYTGKRNQVVVPGEKINPKADSTIAVSKDGNGLAFASATWNFSTERLPEEDRGDFFGVSRKYFLRESTAAGFVLKPLSEGAAVRPGDEVEVQISLRAKHAAEYVHLRDPRAAGLEPENVLSRYKWDLGISWYEETRDAGSNFFFGWLPAGEYTFKYRLRANMAGTFKVGPATVQSMYAPEFAAYSAGAMLTVR